MEADYAVADSGHEIIFSEADAEAVGQSHKKLDAFNQSLAALRACGAMSAAVHLENEIRKVSKKGVACAFVVAKTMKFHRQWRGGATWNIAKPCACATWRQTRTN